MTQTTDAIYQHYESAAKDWRRPHLGASLIGHPCDRYLWYSFRWCMPPEFPGRILRLFDTGNREEERIVKDLRNIGVEIYDRDPKDNSKQIHYADPDCGGHFSGSLDGVARGFQEMPGPWMVCEFKTSNTKGYKELVRKGVEEAKPQHFCQMQTYMAWSGLKKAYYFSVCKETDDIYSEIVPYNEVIAYQLRKRAKKIIFANEPPKRCGGASEDAYVCRYCQFKELCYGHVLPEVNCRSCAHSTPQPSDKAVWSCDRHKKYMFANEQKDEFCPDHIYIPALVPIDVADADADAGTITYADGPVNGPGAVSSREMRCMYENNL